METSQNMLPDMDNMLENGRNTMIGMQTMINSSVDAVDVMGDMVSSSMDMVTEALQYLSVFSDGLLEQEAPRTPDWARPSDWYRACRPIWMCWEA